MGFIQAIKPNVNPINPALLVAIINVAELVEQGGAGQAHPRVGGSREAGAP